MPRAIRIIAWIVGIVALLVAAAVGYVHYANSSASRDANEFCRRAKAGDAVAPLVAAGAGLKIRPLHDRERSEYLFVFPGFGMDKAICRIKISGDKVVSAAATMFYD
jgi:hypothetical protein